MLDDADRRQRMLIEINADGSAPWKKSWLPVTAMPAMSDRKRPQWLTNPLRRLLLPALLVSLPFLPAAAQDIGDPAAGHHLAQTWCSNCHDIEPDSPNQASRGAPAFSVLAANAATTPLALRAFLQTPHDQMPDLHMTHDEVDNLIAYMLSLRRS